MGNRAFEILGIAPTEDGRAIREAFLRLARIYHPDRFVNLPDDVRAEAERRMKEATIAYETLRSRTPAKARREVDEDLIKERAQRYRESIEAKRVVEEHDRARWRRWDEAERLARQKAEIEADIAAAIAAEVDGRYGSAPGANDTDPTPLPKETPRPKVSPRPRDSLDERLGAARRGEKDPLVPRRVQ